MSQKYDKFPLSSKKFIAFLVVEVGFFAIMAMMVSVQEMSKLGENVAFMVLAVSAAFMGVGYCLGQSYIDKFVRVAAITMGHADPGDTQRVE